MLYQINLDSEEFKKAVMGLKTVVVKEDRLKAGDVAFFNRVICRNGMNERTGDSFYAVIKDVERIGENKKVYLDIKVTNIKGLDD